MVLDSAFALAARRLRQAGDGAFEPVQRDSRMVALTSGLVDVAIDQNRPDAQRVGLARCRRFVLFQRLYRPQIDLGHPGFGDQSLELGSMTLEFCALGSQLFPRRRPHRLKRAVCAVDRTAQIAREAGVVLTYRCQGAGFVPVFGDGRKLWPKRAPPLLWGPFDEAARGG